MLYEFLGSLSLLVHLSWRFVGLGCMLPQQVILLESMIYLYTFSLENFNIICLSIPFCDGYGNIF